MSETKVYAARLKNREELLKSSSGGAFAALSEVFLTAGNAIVCANYNYESNEVAFLLTTEKTIRDEARGTKYIQADLSGIYRECESWLNTNPSKKILFFGLGCQAAAFKQYMTIRKLSDRVVVVDIICHGAPSPRVWKDYIGMAAKNEPLTFVNFRDKRGGWDHSIGTAVVNGKDISIHDYRRLYSTRNLTRPSCYFCPYTKIERDSDITIGDFWHIEKKMPDFFDPAGVSLILIHSESGEELFEQAKQYMEYRVSSTKDCWQYNLEKPTQIPDSRYRFWEEYEKYGIEYVTDKYGRTSITKRISKTVKILLQRTGWAE